VAPLKASIAARVIAIVIAIHGVLLPALYVGLGLVVARSHGDLFVQHVRTYSRSLVEELEIGAALDTPQRVGDLLDMAITNGEGVYAEVVEDGRSIRSALNVAGVRWPGRHDFRFAGNDDKLYFIQIPIAREGRQAELRLGFDEQPTLDQIRLAKQRMLGMLGAYLAVAIAVAIVFARRLSRPIVELAHTARRIVSGDTVRSLGLQSSVRELHQLGADLENMRSTLVGVNERLRAEIGEREAAELRRRELESRLRHRHRVETVGTLAGGIAHEINNALLPIMLLAEAAMAEAAPDSQTRADLEAILASARHAKEIVVKVLMFSREADSVALEPIALDGVVREALRLFGLMVSSAVDLRVRVGGPYPLVRADAALTVQLIVNLCNNAYQAMSGRPGTLTVALDAERIEPDGPTALAAGDYLVLTVADTGHGMSPATLERIFEPFFTTRAVGAGSGLGLAVVLGIAESFGASILVASEPDQGSTFRVFFPVAAPIQTAQPATLDEAMR
jgi:signal transduction histidine kinase